MRPCWSWFGVGAWSRALSDLDFVADWLMLNYLMCRTLHRQTYTVILARGTAFTSTLSWAHADWFLRKRPRVFRSIAEFTRAPTGTSISDAFVTRITTQHEPCKCVRILRHRIRSLRNRAAMMTGKELGAALMREVTRPVSALQIVEWDESTRTPSLEEKGSSNSEMRSPSDELAA